MDENQIYYLGRVEKNTIVLKQNSNSFPYRNITSLTDERNVQFRFSVVENITVGTKTIPVYTKGIIMAYTDAVMIGVFGAGDTSELYIGYRSQNTWMINCIK